MNTLKNIMGKYLWLMIPALIYLFFFLIFPSFNIIDDGASLLSASRLSENISISEWSSILIEKEVGRLRPLYHLYFYFLYLIAGTRPFIYWLMQTMILGTTLIIMAQFIYKQTKQYWIAGLFALSLLLFSPTAENFYRLGTAEPKQMLIWLLLLVSLMKIKETGINFKNTLIFVILFLTSLFLKETSIAFTSLIAIYTVWDVLFQKKLKVTSIFTFLLISLISVSFVLIIPKGSYNSGFQINLQNMWNNLLIARLEHAKLFFPLLVLTVGTAIRFISNSLERKLKINTFFWQAVLLSQLLVYLFIAILPWQHQLPRYYYPIYIFAILYFAIEGFHLFTFIKNKFHNKYKELLSSITILTLFFTVIQVKVFLTASTFDLSIGTLKHQFLNYFSNESHMFFLLIIGIASTCIRLIFLYNHRKEKQLSIEDFKPQLLLIFSTFFSLFCTRLIWKDSVESVGFLITLPILLYWVTEYSFWKFESKSNWYTKLTIGPVLSLSIIAICCLLFINQMVFKGRGIQPQKFLGATITHLTTSFDVHQVSYSLISYLLKEIKPETQIFVLADDYEVIFEIGLYASNLERRPVKIHTSNNTLVDDLDEKYPNLLYSSNPVQGYLEASEPKVLLVRKAVWDIFHGTQSSFVIPEYTKPYVSNTVWDNYQHHEFQPPITFGTVPNWANWVVVYAAK